ncbi:hypothetical protein ACFOEE_09560 [Pseudoalteromonas fenneropenaei]|uniref:DUF3592 domain-containing protein n=1 Tax=Pseudoalteromonas fenneropenaei TaxID=1737459 RepID=A0ABV7CJN1_9GAMM
MVKILKNNLNIVFSLIVMFFTGAAILKVYLSEHQVVNGYIDEINCQADKKKDGVYSYQIRLDNEFSFRNRLNVACEIISDLKKGDYIEIESIGHIFIQLKHNGVNLFNKKELNIKRSGISIIFTLLFLLASCDFFYRIYSFKKNRHHQT